METKDIGNYIVYSDGRIFSKRKLKFMKPCVNMNGYCHNRIDGKNNVPFHQIIAHAFILNPENKPCVNHKNGIKSDNRVENLEWVTSSENNLHALKTGLKIKRIGREHHRSKLTRDEVIDIRSNYYLTSKKEMAEKYGLERRTIYNIVKMKSYANV